MTAFVLQRKNKTKHQKPLMKRLLCCCALCKETDTASGSAVSKAPGEPSLMFPLNIRAMY